MAHGPFVGEHVYRPPTQQLAVVECSQLDFPTFSGHTLILTNSPGRLECFGTEITKRTVRPFALIPNFNPFKDRTSRLGTNLQLHILNKFFFSVAQRISIIALS